MDHTCPGARTEGSHHGGEGRTFAGVQITFPRVTAPGDEPEAGLATSPPRQTQDAEIVAVIEGHGEHDVVDQGFALG
jgi:hypothetical protein